MISESCQHHTGRIFATSIVGWHHPLKLAIDQFSCVYIWENIHGGKFDSQCVNFDAWKRKKN
jgi:hypothetical protein